MLSMFLSLCLLFTSLFMFSGCDLLHDNDKRYYSEVVARVGDETITRNEVLTMFNYYYYTMGYSYYGYSSDLVYDMVIEALVKNKILSTEAKKLEQCELTVEDEYYLWEQVFNNINSQIDEYENEIRTLFGVELLPEEEDKEEEELLVFAKYERSTPNGTVKSAEIAKTKEQWKSSLLDETSKDKNYYRHLAYSKYITDLEKNAKKYEKSLKTEDELLEDEFARLYEYYEESRLVEKYTAYVTNQIKVSDDEIVAEYEKAVNEQIQKFAIDGAFDSTITDTSNKDLILYRQGGNYFTVQHILLQFADYDKDLNASEYLYYLDNYVSSYDSNKNLEQSFIDDFLNERNDYALNNEESLNMDYINPNTGKVNLDDNGNEISYTLAEFDDLIYGTNGIYTKYESGEITHEELAEEFLKLKFSFSKDSGVTDLTSVLNLTGYALSTNRSDKNGYVTEFSDTCYALYDEYVESDYEKYGILSVVTNFGVHYIMFTGVMNSGTLSLEDEFSLVTDQTVADYFYEAILTEKESAISSEISSLLYNQYYNAGLIEVYFDTYEDCL